MRFTLLHILFGVAATTMAVPSGVEPGVDLLPKLIPKIEKRQVSVIEGLQSREIGGGFIAVLPQSNSIPADGDDGSTRRGRFLRKDEVIVPKSLQEPSAKRAVYYCRNSGYGICSGTNHCCPLGGDCCSDGETCCDSSQHCCRTRGCCPDTHNCVIVSGIEGCCPIGETCSVTGNGCVDPGYVPCSNDNFCCRPGYTCYRDSLGDRRCRASGSNDDYITTTSRTTTRSTTTTTPATTPESSEPTDVEIPDDDVEIPDDDVEIPDDVTNTDPGVQTTEFAFPTTTSTPSATSNSTSSSSRSSSTPNIPISANSAMAVTLQEGYIFIIAPVLFALGHALVLA